MVACGDDDEAPPANTAPTNEIETPETDVDFVQRFADMYCEKVESCCTAGNQKLSLDCKN